MPSDAPASGQGQSNRGVALYADLVMVRTAEDAIIRHYLEDEMKTPMHMSMGQEAIPVGVCAALGDTADVFCSYRSHATYLARTRDVDGFFAELYGRATGKARGKAGSMHLADIDGGHICSTAIVASGIPVAVGTAFAHHRRKTGRMVATFFGDGAVDEGAFWESLNAAAAMKIPLLFVCEDNGLAVHTDKATRHGYPSINEIIDRFDCIAVEDESNDVERIFDLTADAAARSLAECRPAFLRFGCYRYLEHVGINEDFDAGYRPKSDFDAFQGKDCIAMQRRRLIDQGVEAATLDEIDREMTDRAAHAVEQAAAAPLPGGDELYHGVFHAEA